MDDDVYLVVKSIDLLTYEEVTALPKNLRAVNYYYWTQTSPCETFVDVYGGRIGRGGAQMCHIADGVRPALLIDGLDELDLPLYTELKIFNRGWTYIGNNKVLSNRYLWRGKFDDNSSEYATSEVKQKIDAWLQKQKARFDKD